LCALEKNKCLKIKKKEWTNVVVGDFFIEVPLKYEWLHFCKLFKILLNYCPVPWQDSISRPIAPVFSMAGGVRIEVILVKKPHIYVTQINLLVKTASKERCKQLTLASQFFSFKLSLKFY
jgi:hypothetical protein